MGIASTGDEVEFKIAKSLQTSMLEIKPNQYRREHLAILDGIHKFNQANCAKLRRNIHRLEKGLISSPKREVFALNFIQETVDAYRDALQRNEPEVAWANDVLDLYFKTSNRRHPIVAKAFNSYSLLPSPQVSNKVPYFRNISNRVSYDELLSLTEQRRSVRHFLNKEVPRDKIDQAICVALQSPSACNRQPFVFRIFDDKQMVEKLAALPGGTTGFAHNFPVFVVVIGQQRNFFDIRDRHLIYIDSSLAVMSFILALETLDLSSCCINWPDVEEKEAKMADLLKLEADERPVMCIAVGYPDLTKPIPYSDKKNIDQIRTYHDEH